MAAADVAFDATRMPAYVRNAMAGKLDDKPEAENDNSAAEAIAAADAPETDEFAEPVTEGDGFQKLKIVMLAALSKAEYLQSRHQEAKSLRLKLTLLDALVTEQRQRISEETNRAKRQRIQQQQDLPDWYNWPDVTDEGKAKVRSQINIHYFLKREGISLSFDMFAHLTIVTRGGKTETLTDEVSKGLWLEADARGLQSKDTYFHAVLEDTARKSSFHPIRDYLDGLVWDGEPRLDKWLHTYLKAEDTELNSAYGRKHLIAGVKRVRRPGAKHDPMLILEGTQGDEKSTAIETLCANEDWYSDNMTVGANSKEIIEQTDGKWLFEIPELDGMSRREAGAAKASLSRRVDRARLAYGRARSDRPRQCIFFGTVNEQHYLHDPTGNRRYWPVSVGPADVAGLKRDRDQLWAEVAHYEGQGESVVLPKHLWKVAAEGQAERTIVDPWLEKLSDVAPAHDKPDFIKSETIYRLLDIPVERRAGATGKRVAQIMRVLGYTRAQKRDGGRPEWGYRPNP